MTFLLVVTFLLGVHLIAMLRDRIEATFREARRIVP